MQQSLVSMLEGRLADSKRTSTLGKRYMGTHGSTSHHIGLTSAIDCHRPRCFVLRLTWNS